MVLPIMYSNSSYSATNSIVKKRKRKTNKKLSEFETFKKYEPELPDFTCPHIDKVNDFLQKSTEQLELLRTMNSQLRDNAEYWKSCCEEMQETINELSELRLNIKNLVN